MAEPDSSGVREDRDGEGRFRRISGEYSTKPLRWLSDWKKRSADENVYRMGPFKWWKKKLGFK